MFSRTEEILVNILWIESGFLTVEKKELQIRKRKRRDEPCGAGPEAGSG